MAPLPALAESLGDCAVGLGQLRHHQRLRHEADAVSAPLLGHRRGPHTEPGALLEDLPVPRVTRIGNLIALQRNRTYFFVCEFTRLQLPRALIFVQCKIHANSSKCRKASPQTMQTANNPLTRSCAIPPHMPEFEARLWYHFRHK